MGELESKPKRFQRAREVLGRLGSALTTDDNYDASLGALVAVHKQIDREQADNLSQQTKRMPEEAESFKNLEVAGYSKETIGLAAQQGVEHARQAIETGTDTTEAIERGLERALDSVEGRIGSIEAGNLSDLKSVLRAAIGENISDDTYDERRDRLRGFTRT